MHRVNKKWIHENKTKRGGFTKAQLAAIGVSWPPKAGWVERSSGKLITDEQKDIFESFSDKEPRITGEFQESCNCDVPPWMHCEHTSSIFMELDSCPK